ncbi:unnamed protein product [Zymoseptoria tritici ST99CH_1A5]|uniref:Uncharacterized protein n=1 Tax=Zymoseptoria tritici ST99CH_1A5 TaxID=1276529 RepID=A0A1Y6LN63_ZYMTR|nr:unnamed protein product [Zymoseptoria tritici ST99CH_1A5]
MRSQTLAAYRSGHCLLLLSADRNDDSVNDSGKDDDGKIYDIERSASADPNCDKHPASPDADSASSNTDDDVSHHSASLDIAAVDPDGHIYASSPNADPSSTDSDNHRRLDELECSAGKHQHCDCDHNKRWPDHHQYKYKHSTRIYCDINSASFYAATFDNDSDNSAACLNSPRFNFYGYQHPSAADANASSSNHDDDCHINAASFYTSSINGHRNQYAARRDSNAAAADADGDSRDHSACIDLAAFDARHHEYTAGSYPDDNPRCQHCDVITVTYTTQRVTTTTSSSSIIRPAVALRTPIVIAGSPISAPSNQDDVVYAANNLPMPLTIYGTTTSRVNVSSNGIIALSPLTTAYANAALPVYSIAPVAIFPCWDDLVISAGQTQGIFYGIDGVSPNRAITFEYYVAKYQATTFYYHFLVTQWENITGTWTIDYLNMSDSGAGATIGIQSQTAGRFAQFSLNTASAPAGRIISFNPANNSWYDGLPAGITGIPGVYYW